MHEPLLLRCTECDGEGCPACGGRGSTEITSCPAKMVTPDVRELLRWVDRMKRGIPPVHGGGLDQTESFMAANDLVVGEDAYWEAKALEGKPGK